MFSPKHLNPTADLIEFFNLFRVVDYILIHELAHLQESNHTDAFWSLVAEHDPEYESHAAWLEENSTRLIFSEEDI